MTIKAGILADTHVNEPDSEFLRLAGRFSAGCRMILEAGDSLSCTIHEVRR